jgi:carboxypeptidase Taq
LLSWLQTNLHALGRKYDVNDTIVRATGRALTIEHYLDYLKAKFGDLYDLS